ncbi:tRNA lysidine(34) synthetase TilS [Sphingobacterium sp. SYP-B4668]|uniref:tRNA lysidine(34) synthetase TilS n=1 Tax=Sphingobacterium sp. SYP-B4668 TaxID=2996035 RepID=UPI0022DE4929|nr:tRNA lysidine(34) synthetase TilS [Sphingobacterium sp. SYP-B4668]
MLHMNVLERFKAYVYQNNLFQIDDRVLLAVSGGKDSMLMAKLFIDASIDIIIAHCNFSLRGEESDKDEALVATFAEQYAIPFFSKQFDTIGYAELHKISIQMAARDLRYDWFEKLRSEHACRCIAIAQHKNDHIETVLLNIVRGTGLAGLQGIQAKRGAIIRPLLFLDAKEITRLIVELDVPYRDDQSNFSTKYARNKIRLDVVPRLEEINPEFVKGLCQSVVHFSDAYTLLRQFVDPIREALFKNRVVKNEIVIRKEELQPHLKNIPLLYALFEPYHFQMNVLMDLVNSWSNENGRIFDSTTHRILVDRSALILRPIQSIQEEQNDITWIAEGDTEICWNDMRFQALYSETPTISFNRNVACIDREKIIFPLQIRSWQEGDVFYPIGMRGKKKISDYFIQQKINLFDKARVPILIDGSGEVIWIANYRLDNRFKITDNTKKVLTLVCE